MASLVEGLSTVLLSTLLEWLTTLLVTVERFTSLISAFVEGLSPLLVVVIAVLIVEGLASLLPKRLAPFLLVERLSSLLLTERLALGLILFELFMRNSSSTLILIVFLIIILVIFVLIFILNIIIDFLITIKIVKVLVILEIIIVFFIVVLLGRSWLNYWWSCLLFRLSSDWFLLR